MMTVNISLPSNMYQDIKKTMQERGYSSVSELVRDAVRKIIYPEFTENGFTPEFEDAVLRSAKKSVDEKDVWKSPEDIDRYFARLNKLHKNDD
jgi:Arc/MetJ-type ribon-helix-helix transcriptional regulator